LTGRRIRRPGSFECSDKSSAALLLDKINKVSIGVDFFQTVVALSSLARARLRIQSSFLALLSLTKSSFTLEGFILILLLTFLPGIFRAA
jgi:hypothetical protein